MKGNLPIQKPQARLQQEDGLKQEARPKQEDQVKQEA